MTTAVAATLPTPAGGVPRIATMPWTAPVFDERSATADPILICMSSRPGLDGDGKRVEGSCTCVTEQATAYDISEPECRTLARYGPVYNPYREHSQERSQRPQQEQQMAAQPGQGASVKQGGVATKQTRALGTFPEPPQYETKTTVPSTTRDI